MVDVASNPMFVVISIGLITTGGLGDGVGLGAGLTPGVGVMVGTGLGAGGV